MKIPMAILLAASTAAASAAAAQTTDTFEWRGTVPVGTMVEVRGVNGDIEAVAAAGAGVEVRAVKTGRKSDPRGVRIEVVQDARGVLVCAVYPSSDEERPNRCAREDHRSNVRNNDVDVDFVVRVPAGVGLVARTVNGKVRAAGLSGDVEATTVNGGIVVATAGAASATTVNGSIEARTGRAGWSGTRQYRTVNGSITIHLPADVRAEVEGRTLNGGLESDFPLTTHATRFTGQRRFEGTIGGGGGGRLEVETVNGAIRLRRGGAS